jgi:hypothetical protein
METVRVRTLEDIRQGYDHGEQAVVAMVMQVVADFMVVVRQQ